MQNLFRYTVIALLLLIASSSLQLKAQILDDSTRLVYGPRTTQFTTENDLLYNTGYIYNPDTTLRHFHRFTEIERRNYHYQDLGVVGTAMASVFYQEPSRIGARTGYNVYDHWFRGPENIRYYNTKSPYTKLQYVLGGEARSNLFVSHSRNVNPQWNIGIDFRRLTSDRQIDPAANRNSNQNKNVVSTAYDFHTSYRTKNGRYHVLANFSRLNHIVNETGGIAVDSLPDLVSDIIEYENSDSRLQNASSEQLQIRYHIYQQFQLNPLAQVYHRLDRDRQRNQYLHSPLTGFVQSGTDTSPRYYEQALISTDSTTDRMEQVYWQNELGLKGDVGSLYYRLYYKRRDIQYTHKYLLPTQESEDYAGFALRLAADSTLMIGVEGEYLWGGYYRAGANIRLKWFEGSLHRLRYKPAYIHEQYFGNHNEWYNNFEAPTANVLQASVRLPFNRFDFRGGIRASLVERHIFFTADELGYDVRPRNVRPEQAGSSAQILSPYVYLRWEIIPGFFWENDLTYSMVGGNSASVFNVPDFIYNTSLFYEGEMFGGNLYGQLGLDAHWRSAYYANGYDPVTQQFLLQNEFEVPAYPVVDLFFGFRISRTRVFLRLSHLNEGLTGDGYFLTPYYSGTKRTFDLGIDWLFFD